MKITLKRNGKIQVFDAICTMEVYQSEREDYYNILKNISDHGVDYDKLTGLINSKQAKLVIDGIITHLQKINLINHRYSLTNRGTEFLKTKRFPTNEKGKYKFWKIEDPLFGAILLDFKREKTGNQTISDQRYDLIEMVEFDRYDTDSSFKVLKFDRCNNESNTFKCMEQDNLSTDYKLIWKIDLDEANQSTIYLNGELKCNSGPNKLVKDKKINKIIDFDLKEFLIDLVEADNPDYKWESNVNALQIPYTNDLTYRTKTEFRLDMPLQNIQTKVGNFDPSMIKGIPVMPDTEKSAVEWFTFLISDYVEKVGYINEVDLKNKLEEELPRKEFKCYNAVLKEMRIEYFLDEFKKKKQIVEFWNLQTGIDLLPNNIQTYVLDNWHIPVGYLMSMRELVKKILGKEVPTTLVFSSKYLKKKYQIKKFELFAQAFKEIGVKNIELIVPDKINLTDKSITIRLYEDIYGSVPKTYPHDRYFAFQSAAGWNYYKMSAELDQCQFDSPIEEITIDTVCTWKDISISHIEQELFPEKAVNFIQSL